MIGPGTGVAPFRAFLQEREARRRPGRNWLFFGDRNCARFPLSARMAGRAQERRCSRASTSPSRATSARRSTSSTGCGRTRRDYGRGSRKARTLCLRRCDAMAKDVQTTLVRIVAEESGRTEEAAADYLHGLQKSGRYLKTSTMQLNLGAESAVNARLALARPATVMRHVGRKRRECGPCGIPQSGSARAERVPGGSYGREEKRRPSRV